jgi:threonine/homoserine efflux transporter RhtA
VVPRDDGGLDTGADRLEAGRSSLARRTRGGAADVCTAAALASVAVLGIVCTAFAMILMFYLVNHAGASRATLITYLNPAVASLLGVMLLDERLGAGGLLAFGLILLGSWLATRRSPRGLVELAAER